MKRHFIKQPKYVKCSSVSTFNESYSKDKGKIHQLHSELLADLEDEVLEEMGLELQLYSSRIQIRSEDGSSMPLSGYSKGDYIADVASIASDCNTDEEYKTSYMEYIQSLLDEA